MKIRFIPLRYRYIAMTSGMLILVLGVLAGTLSQFQSKTIQRELERRGLAIGRSLAATSRSDLITYNYGALERAANQAVDGRDVVYVIIHDKEGRVAGYSNRSELQNKVLEDEMTVMALEREEPFAQHGAYLSDKTPVLEVVHPVFLPATNARWGTIRVGLSLEHMFNQIRNIQLIIFGIGALALACGVLMSIWSARRITRPMNDLVQATIKAARGDLSQDVQVHTRDEVEILARNFAIMIREILSHRQQLEERIEQITQLQQYREKLLTTMADGLVSVDTGGRVMTLNPAARTILGISDQDEQVALLESMGPHLNPLLAYVRGALASPDDVTGLGTQEIVFQKQGERCFILVGMSFLRNAENEPRELIITIHDITELKRLEASVRQAERLSALGTLAAGMAHEIRNPLSAIKTFVQLLPRKVGKPTFLEKFNRTVPREIGRINQLVEELLELSRVPKYNFELTRVTPIVEQTLELLEEEMISRNVRWEFECKEELPEVWIDVEQLPKAFHNIIRNAVQAMPQGGRLGITARVVESSEGAEGKALGGGAIREWVEIIFQDCGQGIAEKHLDQIFNPFFTTKEQGTGLGLSITHKIVTEHQGVIDIQSIAGRGTTVGIRLPIQKHQKGQSGRNSVS